MIPGTLFRLAAASVALACALPAAAEVPAPHPRPATLGVSAAPFSAPIPVAQSPAIEEAVPAAPQAAPAAPQNVPAPPAAVSQTTGETPPDALTPAEPITPATPAEPVTAATPEAAATEVYAEDAAEAPAEVAAPLDLTNPEALPQATPAAPLAVPNAMLAAANPVDTADEQGTLAKVNTYFNGISTLVGNFVQIGPDGSRADGKFFLRKPGKVRFYYQRPSTTDIIADGKSLVVRDRRLNTQDVYPLSQTPLKFLLERNLDLARDSKVVGVHEEPGLVSVAIEEETTFGGKARVLIVFASEDGVNYELKQWTITDPQGLDTTIAVSQLDTASKPDDKLFAVDYTRDISTR